jgi:hypothetical protein
LSQREAGDDSAEDDIHDTASCVLGVFLAHQLSSIQESDAISATSCPALQQALIQLQLHESGTAVLVLLLEQGQVQCDETRSERKLEESTTK